ncbi:hypothetical protein C0Q70_06050 [Pomacea canaliculata]|uniref:Homeobox domain-containing protein n=1 Tax=Pomacea canaliculata TaxID=400727 RepID=A0A2T7PMX7_POMCA|nr:hypothetical protein C0Q70_06050 [Pomacea canaliculata]
MGPPPNFKGSRNGTAKLLRVWSVGSQRTVEWSRHDTLTGCKTRTKDKYRVVYSDHQRLELEKEFHFSRYITIRRKAEIAQQLALSERQVKIWFQNRRAKERKQNKKREEAMRNGTGVPKLEPLDSPPPITASHHPHSHAHSPNMGMGMSQHHHHQQQQPPQHHAMSMAPVPGEGGLAHPQLHSPVPSSHHYAPQRISPLPNQGVGPHDNLPQTATPTGPPIQTSVSVNCSTIPHRSQNVPTPLYDKKPDMA